MFLSLRGWITFFLISLLASAFGLNQGVIFFLLYTIPLIIVHIYALQVNLTFSSEIANLLNFDIKNDIKVLTFSSIKVAIVYTVIFIISSKVPNIDFYVTFEIVTLLISIMQKK